VNLPSWLPGAVRGQVRALCRPKKTALQLIVMNLGRKRLGAALEACLRREENMPGQGRLPSQA